MPTITAGDFRNGVTFEKDGSVCTVVEFQHVKPGKGAAFVRTKYKNVMTGAIREESFNPTAKFEQATVERKDAEYSYNDGDLYYFMAVSDTHLDVYKRQGEALRCASGGAAASGDRRGSMKQSESRGSDISQGAKSLPCEV